MALTQNTRQHTILINGHLLSDAAMGAVLATSATLFICVAINFLFSRPLDWTLGAPAAIADPGSMTATTPQGAHEQLVVPGATSTPSGAE